MDFSAETRRHNLARLERERFDLLVIGGGITGAGIAQAAALRGYRVALVERGDFASGASGRSSKLVHGGLRYLASGDLRLVAEACRERHTLLRSAPDLVRPLPFILPIYSGGSTPMSGVRLAMWAYDALAGFRNVRAHRMLSAREALRIAPSIAPERLVGAAHYYDCATDDARLTLAVVQAAHEAGAVVASYLEVRELLRARGRIVGAHVYDLNRGGWFDLSASLVVSAVGPWTDQLVGGPGGSAGRALRPTKGAHLVVPRSRVPAESAVAFRSPRDGRFLYVVPWGDHAILGTTDTDYDDDPAAARATTDDAAYLLEAARHVFPGSDLCERDIVSTFAGVRPLLGQDDRVGWRRSREHRVWEPEPGLLAVAGGKLTTYRPMARATVDAAARLLARDCHTAPRGRAPSELAQRLGDLRQPLLDEATAAPLPAHVLAGLRAIYGGAVGRVLRLTGEQPALAEPVAPGLSLIKAQVLHAAREEMAVTVSDVLDRRTHVLHTTVDHGRGAAPAVADLLAAELGWTALQRAGHLAAYLQLAELARAPGATRAPEDESARLVLRFGHGAPTASRSVR